MTSIVNFKVILHRFAIYCSALSNVSTLPFFLSFFFLAFHERALKNYPEYGHHSLVCLLFSHPQASEAGGHPIYLSILVFILLGLFQVSFPLVNNTAPISISK